MELRQLRYFVAVAELNNISRAAKKLFLTQPALSRQIKALEEEVGQCLLERKAHSIRLTTAGEVLLHEARVLLEQADQLLERVRADGKAVRLRVGYAPSLAGGVLSAAVETFVQKHPGARVELFDLSTKEMLVGLENGTLEVALTVASHITRGLKWTSLIRGSWQLAVSRNHPLAKRSRIPAADVARESLLVFCQRDYPEYWEVVTDWLRSHKLRPAVAGEFDGVNSLLAAVESGLGVALVNSSSARLIPQRVQLKTLSDPPKPFCIAAGYRPNPDKVLAEFIEVLKNAAES